MEDWVEASGLGSHGNRVGGSWQRKVEVQVMEMETVQHVDVGECWS